MLVKFRHLILSFVLVLFVVIISSFKPTVYAYRLLSQEEWVDSIMQSLTEEEVLGQLFMVAAYSNRDATHVKEIEELVTKYNIGGIIFFQGGPVRQAILTNRYQAQAKVPLFIAMDAEWGLNMRLDSTIAYPKQMTLGAISNDEHIYLMGKEIGRQCRRLGVHINFAPVVDINSNPANPVIGMRSFGEDKEKVADKGIAYMRGMQDMQVMANAKHFPGHGDTESDSHASLPVINHDDARLQNIEFYPFKKLIDAGVKSVMVGHISVPAYEKTSNLAATLSENIVTNKLKGELGFKGLVFTDALNMKGVSSYYKPGEVDVKALLAGNDVLLFAENVPLAIKKIQKAIKDKQISKEEVFARVRKILDAKYWAGLNAFTPIQTEGLYEDLNSSWANSVRWQTYNKSVTVVQNKDNLLPVQNLDPQRFASIVIGEKEGSEFQKSLNNYVSMDHYNIADKTLSGTDVDALTAKLSQYDVVIVGLVNTNIFNSKNFGISDKARDFISGLPSKIKSKVVVAVFANPYSMKYFTAVPNLICAYEDNATTQSIVPQIIFGALPAEGFLPVTACPEFKAGKGIVLPTLKRLSFAPPEYAKMDYATLSRIDTLIDRCIREGVMPGCQVVIAKSGVVVFNKAYGWLDYQKTSPVNTNTIYDIASITKVASTTQAVMFLHERGLIDLNKTAGDYLPELKGTNKEDLLIKDILTHQAGLIPFLPHWRRTIDNNGFMKQFYDTVRSEQYPNAVTEKLYSIAAMEDSVWKWTVESPLLKKPVLVKKGKRNKKVKVVAQHYSYTYSDIGFYIMKRIVERITNQPIDHFMADNFYTPLGLRNFQFKPAEKMNTAGIAPTENDIYFRKQLVQGYVHDQGASMIGGVGGHAGVFGSGLELSILMQMNLQYGEYGGNRYILPETIRNFTSRQFPTNRRGLGWDRPDKGHHGPTSYLASEKTFGHSGFTGTAVWVDPVQEIVYVFISNRVNPDASNNRLNKDNIRPFIQTLVYKSILNYKAPF
ncbi:MAG: nagA [Chitinophagaceae bacterium]|nr:nagA [Chitinophagaceae bacterium]